LIEKAGRSKEGKTGRKGERKMREKLFLYISPLFKIQISSHDLNLALKKHLMKNTYSAFLASFLVPFYLLPDHVVDSNNDYRSNVQVDTTPPVVYCLTGVLAVTMPYTGCILIHAKELDRGSFDETSPKDKLHFYFNGDKNKDSIIICCDAFVAAGVQDELPLPVEMWVEDEAGNKSFCKTTLLIQDLNNVCPHSDPFYNISGKIIYKDTKYSGYAYISLTSPFGPTQTKSGSEFNFRIVGEGNYQLCLKYNNFSRVSSADIVLIQRHILGVKNFTSPFDLIAADVNLSYSISATDLSEIRKLILGIIPKFDKVPSSIYIPKDSVSTQRPLNVKKYLSGCLTIEIKGDKQIDFIEVGMGDVSTK
jgi:hypothetical protein